MVSGTSPSATERASARAVSTAQRVSRRRDEDEGGAASFQNEKTAGTFQPLIASNSWLPLPDREITSLSGRQMICCPARLIHGVNAVLAGTRTLAMRMRPGSAWIVRG